MKRNLPALLLSLLCVFLCLILVSCKGSSGGASKPAPTGDETLDLLNSVSAGLTEKLAGYYDENGYVAQNDVETVMMEAANYLRSIAGENNFTVSEFSTDAIILDLPDGSSAVYAAPVEDMAGGGTDLTILDFCQDALSSDPGASEDYHTVMPWFRHDLFGDGIQFQRKLAENFRINNGDTGGKFLYYDTDALLDTPRGFLDFITTFDTDGVLEIIGHGTYTRSYGTLITSPLTPSPENDALYAEELKNKRMFHTLSGWQTPDDGHVFFLDYTYSHYLLSSRFFEDHLNPGSLEGAVVYLGVCSGLRDNAKLADVFLAKGARAVYGFDKPIAISYVCLMSDIANILTTRRFELNDRYPDLTTDYRATDDYRYPSYQEALVIARELYRDPDPFNPGAEDHGRLVMQTKNRDDALIHDAAACFEGGRGTKLDPYRITSGDNLEYMRRYSRACKPSHADEAGFKDLYIEMTCDISARGFEGFPKAFMGTFNGGGYTICDLDLLNCVNRLMFYSLFDSVKGGTIKNLTLAGPDVCFEGGLEESAYISSFANVCDDAVLTDCVNKINIICRSAGNDAFVGGITNMSVDSTLTNCVNEGNIQATIAAGIAQAGNGSTFTNCINHGAIRGVSYPNPDYRKPIVHATAAGIVATSLPRRISGCVNYGTVTADDGYAVSYGVGEVIHITIPGSSAGILSWPDEYSLSNLPDYITVIENCENHGAIGKDHNKSAQITHRSDIIIKDCAEQGDICSTPLPDPASEDPAEKTEKQPEETDVPETEAETEEPPPKPPVISVGGLFDFEAPLSPSGITYVITITADGDLEDKSIQTITNQAICIVDSGLDFSFERDSKGDTGYLYLTVNWDKPGTYHITVGVDGKSYPATITVK